MKVCIENATGKLIEMQSSATSGTLLSNAQGSGWQLADIEEKEVTQEEWAAIQEEWIDKPQRDEEKKRLDSRIVVEETVRSKLGFTEEEWGMLKDILKDN
jgi:hypothetical protein